MTRAAQNIDIRALSEESAALLDAHLRRHFAESGRNGFHFVPFDLQTDSGPGGVSLENCFIPVGAPQWQRWFLAHDRASGDVLGHVDLKAYSLKTSAHRCLLGIGLEERARGQGFFLVAVGRKQKGYRKEEQGEFLHILIFECSFLSVRPTAGIRSRSGVNRRW